MMRSALPDEDTIVVLRCGERKQVLASQVEPETRRMQTNTSLRRRMKCRLHGATQPLILDVLYIASYNPSIILDVVYIAWLAFGLTGQVETEILGVHRNG